MKPAHPLLHDCVRRGRIFPLLLAAFLCSAQPSSLLDRGVRAFQNGDFEAAEKLFREAVRQQPGSARARKWLGMTFSAREKYVEAEPHFRAACSLDAREENACYYLGRTLYTLSRLDAARDALELALQKSEKKGRPLHGLALVFEALGRTADAERYYRQAVARGEDRARIDLGLLLFKTGRGQESLRELRAAAVRIAEARPVLERVEKALRDAPPKPAPAASPPPIRFQTSTLDMIVRNGATGNRHLIESVAGGVAVLDFDNDGWPDIYVANGAEIASMRKVDSSYWNRLFRNNHDGTFQDVTEKAAVAGAGFSMGVAAADYDNDGWTDLFVTGVRSHTLFHNRGDGTFEDATAAAGVVGSGDWSVAAGWFDYDHDGRLDLFVVRYVVWDPAKEIDCGLQQFGHRTYCHPSHYAPLPNALYHNEGNGRFRDVSAESGIAAHKGKGMSLAFGDYDGDGRLDVFVTNDTVPNFLFHNEGQGRFRESALAAGVAYNQDGKAISAMGVDFRDYDNDGREDLFITALTNETFPLFRNLGGRFADMTALSRIAQATLAWTGWGTGWIDFNNDGHKDIFVAGGHVLDNAELVSSRKSRQPNLVLTNSGDGTFTGEAAGTEAFHRAAGFGDFDRDGKLDVAVVRLNQAPLLLRNISPAQHWIALELKGTRSNRDAIGAQVHIVTALGEQWNRLVTAYGYGASSQPMVHFGLGRADRVLSLQIVWPSGGKQELKDVAADRYLRVLEP